MGRALLAVAHNRLELFLTEVQEERWKVFQALLLAGVVLILALMTLMVVTVTIVILCIRANQVGIIVVLALAYLAATLIGLWRLHVRLKNWIPFAATLDELKKDKSCLAEMK